MPKPKPPIPDPTPEELSNSYQAGRIAGSLSTGYALESSRKQRSRTFWSGFFCAMGVVAIMQHFGMFLKAWP